MALRINFNYESAVTHTALKQNERLMNKSLLRLSTGLRILNAADDSAGLFISDQLALVSAGLEQGNRNIQTGISALQIAENSAGQIYNKLKEIYVKAQNAANDINDPNARAALQREINNLVDAIQKIATDTEYNGIKLLDGTFTSKYIHYGPRVNQKVTINISSLQTNDLGAFVSQSSGNAKVEQIALNETYVPVTGINGKVSANTNLANFANDKYVASTGENLVVSVGGNTYTFTANSISVNHATDWGSRRFFDAQQAANAINTTLSTTQGIHAYAVNSLTAAATWGTSLAVLNNTSSAVANITIKIYAGSQKVFSHTYTKTFGTNGTQNVSLTLASLIQDINNSAGTYITATSNAGKLRLISKDGRTIAIEITATVSAAGGGNASVHINLRKFMDDTTTTAYSLGVFDAGGGGTTTSSASAVRVGELFIWGTQDFNVTAPTGTDGPWIVGTKQTWDNTGYVVDSGDFLKISGGSLANSVTLTGSQLGVSNSAFGNRIFLDAAKIAQTINENTDLKGAGITAFAVNDKVAGSAFGTALGNVTWSDVGTGDNLAGTVTARVKIYVGNTLVFDKTYTDNVDETRSTFGPDLDTLIQDINTSPLNGNLLSAGKDATGTKLKLTSANGETVLVQVDLSADLDTTTATDGADAISATVDMSKLVADSTATVITAFNNKLGNNITDRGSGVNVGDLIIAGGDNFNISASGITGLTISTATFQNLNNIDVTSNITAEIATVITDAAIRKVDTVRSQIGAVMNNLQSIFDAQKVAKDNTNEAENVIRNVDFAEEMSRFTTMQIRMQSGIAMLAQANTLPQLVLQLLR